MDVLSHALWGGVALGRKNGRQYLLAGAFSVLPDVVGEGVMFSLALLGLPGMPSLAHGHPDISEFPAYAQHFYNAGHSLAVFAALFALAWALLRRPPWPLAAWALHILIDIPTHSLALFPTPFLWPFSDARVDGIPWRSPFVLVTSSTSLAVVYGLWLLRRRRSGDGGR